MASETLKKYAGMAIDALGGGTKVAELLGIDERVVSNWPDRGLPPDTYHALPPLLQKLGIDTPPTMWRQRLIQRKKVKRPPRRQNGNGKARHR